MSIHRTPVLTRCGRHWADAGGEGVFCHKRASKIWNLLESVEKIRLCVSSTPVPGAIQFERFPLKNFVRRDGSEQEEIEILCGPLFFWLEECFENTTEVWAWIEEA